MAGASDPSEPTFPPTDRASAAPVVRALEEILLPERLASVANEIDDAGMISTPSLSRAQIASEFSERRLLLILTTPVKDRKLTILSLSGRARRLEDAKSIQPAKVSAFLNLNSRGYHSQNVTRFDQAFVSSVNYRGWVTRIDALLRTHGDSGLNHASLHRDDFSRNLRYTAGSFFSPIVEPGVREDLLGISITSISAQDFYERPAPEAIERFKLTEKGDVEVWMNGGLYHRYRLDAGRYELRDFPISDGLNHIAVYSLGHGSGDAGERRYLKAERRIVWVQDMLFADEQQFSAGIGVPSRLRASASTDEKLEPVATGLYRRGVSDQLTVGSSLVATPSRWSVGVNALFGSRFGLVEFGTGVSQFSGETVRTAGMLRFRNYSRATLGNWLTGYGVTLFAEAPHFGQHTSSEVLRTRAFSASAHTSFRFTRNHTGTTRFSYNVYRNRPDELGFGLSFLHRLTRDIQVRTGGDLRIDTRGAVTGFGTVTLTHHQRKWNSRTALRFDGPDFGTALEWSKRGVLLDEMRLRLAQRGGEDYLVDGNIHVAGWNMGASSSRRDGDDAIRGRVSFSGSRGTMHLNVSNEEFQGSSELRGDFSLDGAVVYADGQFAFSRAVRDSFIILKPNPRYEKSMIRYSNNAKSDAFGPAVVASLRPLRLNNIQVIESDLPIGAWIPQRKRSLVPLAATGYLVMVGAGGGVLAEGQLVDEQMRPIALAAGTIQPLGDSESPGDPEFPAQPFFTNDGGEFTLIDLDPGRYRLKIFTHPPSEIELEIPEDAARVHDFGVQVVRPAAR